MAERNYNVAIFLIFLGSVISLIFYQGSVTPVVPPVARQLSSAIDERTAIYNLPFKPKVGISDDSEMSSKDRFYFLNFQDASLVHLPFCLGVFIWMSGALLLLIRVGFTPRLNDSRLFFTVAMFVSLYGIKHVFAGITEAIMAIDTMGISGGSDPWQLSLSIGNSISLIRVGWAVLLASALLFMALHKHTFRKTTQPTVVNRKSKVVALAGIGLLSSGFVASFWNFYSGLKLRKLGVDVEPVEMAGIVSNFLLSFAFITLTSFFALVALAICTFVRKKI